MRIEVLFFDGCPNHEALLPRLQELLSAHGVADPIELRRVEDEATAERERFLGSPTLRVDGKDVDPGAHKRQDFGLKCRLFATSDGLRGMPADEWVVSALERAGRLRPGENHQASGMRGERDAKLIRELWAAVARGDVDVAVEALDPGVRWHGAGDPEGGCQNRGEARAFIRQALDDGVSAEALEVRPAGERVLVLVQTHQPSEWGEQPEPHGELVTVVDGKITEIIVFPTIHDAVADVGGEPLSG